MTSTFKAEKLLPQLVEFARQVEVLFGQAAGVVRGQAQLDFVPADVDVGMVPGLFGHGCERVDELDRGREILELIRARDGRPGLLPGWNRGQRYLDLFGR